MAFMMQQQNAHLEVEDRCALGSVTSRELKPWLLAFATMQMMPLRFCTGPSEIQNCSKIPMRPRFPPSWFHP